MKKIVVFWAYFLSGTITGVGQVAINSDASQADPSSMLDIKSITKGILFPRMTAAQRDAIISPAAGLMIFCLDNSMYYSNKGTPFSPNWVIVNSKWLTNGSSIYYPGGKVGIGTTTPASLFEIANGNNWDLINGEGDLRIGNNQYRLKMGVALGGGGAGFAGIMQSGQPGGYNVLSLGAQGNYLLFINGGSQKVGIGTDYPAATLDIHGTLSVVDGTQGAGKVLTSNANGLASWSVATNNSPHFIGEVWGGGIVFYIYDNGQHGLIASTADQSAGIRWYGGAFTNAMAYADGVGAGRANTAIIIANQGYGDGISYAARICNEYSVNFGGVPYGDWYLPSKSELILLCGEKTVVGGFTTTPNNYYWSSTEVDVNKAWAVEFISCNPTMLNAKQSTYFVRAIRSF